MRKSYHSTQNEAYYSGRVKSLSTFEPKPEVPSLGTYEEVLKKINFLIQLEDDFYNVFSTSDELIELVFKTPALLNKLFQTKGGPIKIIDLLASHPAYHRYVFENSNLAQQFGSSSDYWASSFIFWIYSKEEILKGLLNSEEMMRALARGVKTASHDDEFLCQYLSKKYPVDPQCIEAVLNLKSPPLELALRKKEREEAVYNLLCNLRPVLGMKHNVNNENILII